MDEQACGGGVNVSCFDIAEYATALGVDHDGVVHDRVVVLVVDQPVNTQERGADVSGEQACPRWVRDLGSDLLDEAAKANSGRFEELVKGTSAQRVRGNGSLMMCGKPGLGEHDWLATL